MNDNERIAEWLGKTIHPHDVDQGVPVPGDLIQVVQGGLNLVDGNDQGDTWDDGSWQPDCDITLWHGNDGLLAKVESLGLWREFVDAIPLHLWNKFESGVWVAMTLPPESLASALAEMANELV